MADATFTAGTSFHNCQLERRLDVVMSRMVNRNMSPAACAFTLALGTMVLPVGVALGQADRDAITPEVAARSYENYLKTVQRHHRQKSRGRIYSRNF